MVENVSGSAFRISNFISDCAGPKDDSSCPTQQETKHEDHDRLCSMSVPAVMQWLTGQRHKPLLLSERADFKISVTFEHSCHEKMPGHLICYPIVSACTHTVTFPVSHMNTYANFRHIMTTAMTMGRDFARV